MVRTLISKFVNVSFLVSLVLCGSSFAGVVQITTTSDGYKYLGAPAPVNGTNYYIDVGLFGTPGDHYSIGYAKFNTDLSALMGAEKVFLAINLRNFVQPVFGNGINNQPTGTLYPLTGGNFTLKAVALSAAFPTSGINATWVQNNIVTPAAAGTVVFQNAGINYMDITTTVTNWISSSATIKELAFVGVASNPNTWSLQIGTLEDQMDLDGNFIISEASPMYLTTIPEPSAFALVGLGLCSILRWGRRRKNLTL